MPFTQPPRRTSGIRLFFPPIVRQDVIVLWAWRNGVFALPQVSQPTAALLPMFSTTKLLGHEEEFFNLLESSAEQPDQCVHQLVALLAKLDCTESPDALEDFGSS